VRPRSSGNSARGGPEPAGRSGWLAAGWCLATLTWAATGGAGVARAQTLPADPITIGGGRVVLGGDVSVTASPKDKLFFAYGEYEHSTLRELRVGLSAQVRAGRRLSLLAEVRSDNLSEVSPFALYARVTPFPGRRLDVQVGRIPPTFGRFSRLAYSTQNPLVGHPLAYQYLTSLRPDALPASADELATMRGRGWRSSYTVGDPGFAPGVPLVSALRWDTGVQVTAGWRAMTATGAVTTGTLSNPRVGDDNDGRQFAGRLAVAAAPGLEIGASAARGAFATRSALDAAGVPGMSGADQLARGLDVEYGRGYLVTRAEAIWSEWRIPLAASGRLERLRATSLSVEGRYALLPGVYTAVRAEHLGFGDIVTTRGTVPWDAPVVRVEIGLGYSLQRNLVVRASLQLNERDTGRIASARLPAVQVHYWF
jgi:hypothetical protein